MKARVTFPDGRVQEWRAEGDWKFAVVYWHSIERRWMIASKHRTRASAKRRMTEEWKNLPGVQIVRVTWPDNERKAKREMEKWIPTKVRKTWPG